ncbi:MAG: endopeptidase La [Gammaproteobacteria bacterium]|nr:endopeptidase La [Gammaproteobacteria bacterium]
MSKKPAPKETESGFVESDGNLLLPVLPLRDVVVYPGMVIPLFVGRRKSIRAVEAAMAASKQILLLTQKKAETDDPDPDHIYSVGTVSSILQLLELPDGTVKVLVEGSHRARVEHYEHTDDYFSAQTETLDETAGAESAEIEGLVRSLHKGFEQYVKVNKKIPPEALASLSGIDDASRLTDTISAHMTLKLDEKQKILEILSVRERIEALLKLIESELDILSLEKQIRGRVKQQMEKSQREYYLNEQMKAIQQELSDTDEGASETDELAEKIEEAGMSAEAKKKATHELGKLRMMSPMSAEATVVRNYIDWLVNVPWKKRSRVCRDLKKAERVLEKDHYALDKVKERILEYLAVQNRVKKIKGPILCLVGPPGVGKTSLGQSIARATGREFSRMSLGGVRDEAEIRGHRRTYIGSLPGKIIQNMSRVGVRNPLFLLDEIDKMAMDFRGDPASALLEVLDPEQNHMFNDHYLEVDFDLSDVMFVCTANTLKIPPALLDRMEVIRISGYTEDEKMNIARRYLIPKQMKNNGLKKTELMIPDRAVQSLIRYYTREAGVRNLERELSKICRKTVKQLLLRPREKQIRITAPQLRKLLGVHRFRYGLADENNQVGQVNGLAWTEVGGELLRVEAAIVTGTGKLIYTGQLGDIMQESIKAAQTVVRSRANTLGIQQDFHESKDIHVHVPEGATPKDGPSAGITMTVAIVSALTGSPVKAEVAMTGEITLRGEILPIGGLKEKLLAAMRGGIQAVVIPKENEKDLEELPRNIRQALDIIPCQWIDEAMELALEWMPQPELEEEGQPAGEKPLPEKESQPDPAIHH